MFADVTSIYASIILSLAGPAVLTPQEILGVLGTDLYMAVGQTLPPPRVRVLLARLDYGSRWFHSLPAHMHFAHIGCLIIFHTIIKSWFIHEVEIVRA